MQSITSPEMDLVKASQAYKYNVALNILDDEKLKFHSLE